MLRFRGKKQFFQIFLVLFDADWNLGDTDVEIRQPEVAMWINSTNFLFVN